MATNPAGKRDRPWHFLVTAGSTREKIDEVREWGNIFTGQTGLDVARTFLDLGNVTLLTSNLDHAGEFDGYSGKDGMMGIETFRTHAQLQELLAERMTSGDPVDVVAMSAAIADYRPAGVYRIVEERPSAESGGRETWIVENVQAAKVKSAYEHIAVLGQRTVKLVDQFRGPWGFRGILIKFKLEVGLSDVELLRVAEASRVASGAELIVANTLAMARPADASKGAAYLISGAGARKVARDQLAGTLREWVEARLMASPSPKPVA